MKIKQLTFLERFIDTETPENYWCGIVAYCGENVIFQIAYNKQKNKRDPEPYYYISTVYFPGELIQDDLRKEFTSKKEVKECVQDMFEWIINSFLD